ncbi:hypothetical protein HMPREF0970_00228 [Schaalia odontolytica F0309]|uniref:Uncharacterized protein n=1 Tax=Schaalia odontolytica F0309 TaxID=649742 RepID=D4TWB9_9ACTO|nr:hypothetical protein HMPREF0970_00228 [Schaalia odontolytica F0309]
MHSSHPAINSDDPVKAFNDVGDRLFNRFHQTLVSLSPIQFD